MTPITSTILDITVSYNRWSFILQMCSLSFFFVLSGPLRYNVSILTILMLTIFATHIQHSHVASHLVRVFWSLLLLQSMSQQHTADEKRHMTPGHRSSFRQSAHCYFTMSLTLYGHLKTAEQRTIIQQYADWYTGCWWLGCYIWYSEEGPGRAGAPCSPVIAVPNVTTHPSTANVPTSYYSLWHYNYL